jgi:predicted neutral ceramidase superfamily lipid hydrolase
MASKNSSKASFLPLLIAAIALVVSVALIVLTKNSAHALLPHLIGYVLTPLVVALCMGWDAIDQRKKTKEDPWFEKSPQFSLILRVLTGLSFVAAYPHIVGIATDLAEKFAA